MERVTGIEPAFSAWEADVLPLNYAREQGAKITSRSAGGDEPGGGVEKNAVGLRMLVVRGERVEPGQPLVELHHRAGRGLEAARALCREAIHIDAAGAAGAPGDRILGEVR